MRTLTRPHTRTGSLELNVSPGVVMTGLAVAGLAAGVYAVAVAARRNRSA